MPLCPETHKYRPHGLKTVATTTLYPNKHCSPRGHTSDKSRLLGADKFFSVAIFSLPTTTTTTTTTTM